MKKIVKIFKFLIIGAIWSVFFLWFARVLMKWIWKFDILYHKQWQVLSRYWNDNGVIVGWSDYMFFVALLLLFILWLWGWKKLYRTNYLRLLIAPLQYINNYQLRKYEQKETHIVLKNLSVGEKLTIEDVIKERIKKEDRVPTQKASQDLRQSFSQKIIQRKEE